MPFLSIEGPLQPIYFVSLSYTVRITHSVSWNCFSVSRFLFVSGITVVQSRRFHYVLETFLEKIFLKL